MRTSTRNIRQPVSIRSSSDRLKAGAALGLSVAMLMPTPALAQTEAEEADEAPLATVAVEATAIDPNPNAQVGVPYKARTSGDERHTRPIAELPQTITVLTRAQIEDSGYTDLKQILDSQPGITVGTGENGNAFGDRYIIRGQEARSDVFVDGLRDPGMTTRESFAIEQLEVSKGPSSSFGGRGTAGGAINAITKQATIDYNFGKGSVGIGTDQFVRTTADINYSTGNTFAVRANVLYAYELVPDRGPADRERKGLATSAFYTPTDNFSITADYYGLRAKDNPDLGGYLSADDKPVEVPTYAQQPDFQTADVDVGTARIQYEFSPTVRLNNLTRYGSSDNGYVVTGANGRTNPRVSLSTHNGWQDVEYFANQTNLYVEANLAGLDHELIFGAEYTDHKVLNGIYSVVNTGTPNCGGTTFCVYDTSGKVANGLNTIMGRRITKNRWDQDWRVETISGYVMDTFDIGALTVFAGLRLDNYKFNLNLQNNALAVTSYDDSDTLWNGHLGLTYKVGNGGVVYASIASSADINGGESDVGTSAGYGGFVIVGGVNVGAKPERSWNYEIGTKWNVFDEKLLLTAALFQIEKSDVMEGLTGADYTSAGTLNTGANRVRGFEFEAVGYLTPDWSVQGGFSLMDSKVTDSFNPANIGLPLANFANNQVQVLSRYQITEDFALGGALKYKSKRYGGQPDTGAVITAPGARTVPAYTVVDLFAELHLTDNMELRVNVNNVTNTDYYLAVYRSGSFLYKGDARRVTGTLNISF
ncbi:TonB-dependent receptor [Altererythrobacter sp. Root672]|uniref:TonB-dependent receptor n=1 Tax=Altererythrobacter sp. Root672 TaxID=1736584 RepID=UPI0006F93E53|nr:TonB-dependent siderophore receptor [Altererythrobacter sp. Root672]KRA84419.1 TonB-dependent receptor [Altererythrobacter sp. Root672]